MKISTSAQIKSGFIYKILFIFLTTLNALIVIKILPSEQLGVWYVFMAIQAFILILNNALTPNITRQFSIGVAKANIDIITYCNLIRRIYIYVAIIIAILSILILFFYLEPTLHIFSKKLIFLGWVFLIISILFEVYYSLYECALNGSGLFKETNKINFISRIILTILTLFILLENQKDDINLTLFCLFYFLSNIYKRIKIKRLFFSTFKTSKNTALIKESIYNYHSNKKMLYYLVYLSFISSVGGILITKSSLYILPYYSNLESIASYGLTYQLFEMGFNIIFILTTMLTPMLVNLYYHQFEKIKSIYFKLKYFSLLAYVIGCIFIFYMATPLLNILKVNTLILNQKQLFFLSIVFILQLNHSISGHILTIENKIPFAYPSFFSGLITLILSLILIPIYHIDGAIYSILISQLIFNNWFWPLKSYFFVRKKHEI
uniref:Wzx n=2 Tax=Proteus TaxID=583 RepID=A0A385JN48_PROVU|nr:wzx [Proteus vulgaris]